MTVFVEIVTIMKLKLQHGRICWMYSVHAGNKEPRTVQHIQSNLRTQTIDKFEIEVQVNP